MPYSTWNKVKKKNQNKANKYKIQQNTQLHLAPMLHEKKAKNSHGYSL